MLKLITRGGLLACLLMLLLVMSGNGNPSSPYYYSVSEEPGRNIARIITFTGSDSLILHTKYHDDLTPLVNYFKKKNLAIDNLLLDSRFTIHEGIGDKFRNSAEMRTPGLEEYKRILGFEGKRNKIAGFLNTYADQLSKAEETYGISRHVIAAIIGIESDFGVNVGTYNPFNAYVSMYVDGYRTDFARAQLEELLLWVKRNGVDVFDLKSSYAGAMAFAQFIPYSLNKWFVGDDIYDMNNNILSVANYLAYFKKRTGSIEKAVFRYNPSELYTSAVMDLAREAENIISDASAR